MPVFSLPIVIDAIVKVSAILSGTALVAAALRRASASTRHLVWTLGLISALAVPALAVVTPRWEVPLLRVSMPAAAPIISGDRPAAPPRHLATSTANVRSKSPATAAPTGPAAPWQLPGWPAVLLIVWAAGAAMILGRLAVGLAAVQWLARRTPIVTDAPWLPQARTIARQF